MKITRTTIRKTPGDNEWQVLAYVNNDQGLPFKRYPEADYFTYDKKDAQETAKLMLEFSNNYKK